MRTQSDYWTEHFRGEDDVLEERFDEFLAEAADGEVGRTGRFGTFPRCDDASTRVTVTGERTLAAATCDREGIVREYPGSTPSASGE